MPEAQSAAGKFIPKAPLKFGAQTLTPEGRVWLGSDAMRRMTAVASGISGRWSYQGNIGQTSADNYRQYSRQSLTNGFGRITTSLGVYNFTDEKYSEGSFTQSPARNWLVTTSLRF